MSNESTKPARTPARITRRGFVAGAAALAASAAAAAASAAPSGARADAPAAGEAAGALEPPGAGQSPDAEELPFGNPNYQVPESEYGTADKGLDMLFSPIQVSGKTFRNRICKSGAGCPGSFDENGFPNEQLLSFYESLAKGGAAYIIVDTNSMPVEALRQVADRIHAHGALAGMQHYSMSNWMPGGLSSSSSPVTTGPLDFGTTAPAMATAEDIQGVVGQFVSRAADAFEAGFDGFDINAGCNHFLNSFLSRAYNTGRDDEYGPQSLENRARVVTDIIRGIRERTGDDFVVSVLYNALETDVYSQGRDDGCTQVEEAVGLARIFEDAGASLLHVRWGTHGNHAGAFFPDRLYIGEPGATGYAGVLDWTRGAMDAWEWRYEGAFAAVPIAAKVKAAVQIPVATVGCLDPRLAPDLAEDALESGSVDLLMMTRPLMADPELPNKLQSGRRDEVAPCTHCETCFMSGDGCRVNPVFGRAGTDEMPEAYGDFPQAETPKRVMVVGGGPAGMEAARVAALCGHSVTLYERSSSLGGKLAYASLVKGSHEHLDDYAAYLERQLEVAGVAVKLEAEVTADTVREAAPDALVLACGSAYEEPDYPGFADSPIASGLEAGLACEDERVVIIGHDVQALNMAERLVKRGCAVTVVNEHDGYAASSPAAMATAGGAEAGAGTPEGAPADAAAAAQPAGSAMAGGPEGVAAAAGAGATDAASAAAGPGAPAASSQPDPQAAAAAAPSGHALGENMASYVVEPTLNWLCKHAVKFYNNATVLRVTGSSVEVGTSYGVEVSVPAQAVLYAPQAPQTALAEELGALVGELVCVGDAKEPRNIVKGVAEAHLAARRL